MSCARTAGPADAPSEVISLRSQLPARGVDAAFAPCLPPRLPGLPLNCLSPSEPRATPLSLCDLVSNSDSGSFLGGNFPLGNRPPTPPPPRVQPRTYAPWGQEVLPRFLQRARPREGSLLRGGDPLMVPWAPDPILQSFLRELGPNTHVACEDPSLSRQGRDCVCPRAGWCLGRPRSHTLNPDSTTEPAAPGRPCDRCHCFDSQRDFPAGPTGSQHGSSWESTAHGPAGPERAANQRLPPPPPSLPRAGRGLWLSRHALSASSAAACEQRVRGQSFPSRPSTTGRGPRARSTTCFTAGLTTETSSHRRHASAADPDGCLTRFRAAWPPKSTRRASPSSPSSSSTFSLCVSGARSPFAEEPGHPGFGPPLLQCDASS